MADLLLQTEKQAPPVFNFATVGEVYEDGLTLIFDGQEEATEKHYKCNTSVSFKAGDRVKILQDSGTYVVEYVVGAPSSGGGGGSGVDASTLNGKTEDQLSVLYAKSAGSATTATTATTATNATKLNNTAESGLDVNSAYRVHNAYYAQSSSNGRTYGIQFRSSSAYGGSLQYRIGSGSWTTVATK